MPPALQARGLAKRYGGTEALRGVDVEVAEGELVGLLGPSGAGKSTLVKIAWGLVRPSRGGVDICGAPAGSAHARRALGYLAELFRFPHWMSADELLVLHQRLAGSRGGGRAGGAPARAAGPPSAASCSSWSASRRRVAGASAPCRRGCSSGSESPRRSSGRRACC